MSNKVKCLFGFHEYVWYVIHKAGPPIFGWALLSVVCHRCGYMADHPPREFCRRYAIYMRLICLNFSYGYAQLSLNWFQSLNVLLGFSALWCAKLYEVVLFITIRVVRIVLFTVYNVYNKLYGTAKI